MAAASSNASTSNDSPERVGEQEGLQGDWAALLAEVDSLLLRDDDPRSKYEARRRLLQRPPPPASDAPFTAARRAFRLGRIAVDAEEPAAEAEKLLKEACGVFFPGLHDAVVVAAAADGSAAGLPHAPVVVVGASLVAVLASSSSSSTPWEAVAVAEEALETINLLGILESGREELQRSRAFLLAAVQAHRQLASHLPPSAAAAAATATAGTREYRRPLQGPYAHTLFYLGQVHAALRDFKASAAYLYQTLAEQLEGEVRLDRLSWAANCLGLADILLTSPNDYKAAASCLEACDALLQREAKEETPPPDGAAEQQRRDKLAQTKADVHRRWAALYCQILAAASKAHEFGVAEAGEEAVGPPYSLDIRFPSLGITPAAASSSAVGNSLPAARDVTTFEQARPLFLLASKHLEAAKGYFTLDGFVSDYADLQRDLSRLYRHVSSFETDEKRRAAMYLRRAGALQPLVDQLSPTAYTALHKMLAYELGEVHGSLMAIKTERIQEKLDKDSAYRPSKTEAAKCDEYCSLAIRAFEHFVRLYQQQQQQQQEEEEEDEATIKATEPSYNFESREDLGPVLRAHFHLAQLHGRLHAYSSLVCVPPAEGQAQRVAAAKRSLAAYEWLGAFAKEQVETWYGAGAGFWAEEMAMCAEMAKTLPEKIGRICQGVRFRA